MSDLVLIAGLSVAALCVAFILYRAFRSPLRVLPIPVEAWRVAVASVRATPVPVALAALVIGLGAGLQEFFTYGPKLDATALTVASIVWQALVAVVLAMIAVPFHLHIIGREPTGFVVPGRRAAPPTLSRPLLLRAAALGGAIWLVTYLVDILGKLAVISVPEDLAVLTYRGVQLAGFLVGTVLALIRPALSSGLHNPVGAGLRLAIAEFPALLTVKGLLLIPPAVFGIVGIALVRQFLGLSLGVHILNDVSIVVFSTFQFLAVEAATVILLRSAILVPGPGAYEESSYALARPY